MFDAIRPVGIQFFPVPNSSRALICAPNSRASRPHGSCHISLWIFLRLFGVPWVKADKAGGLGWPTLLTRKICFPIGKESLASTKIIPCPPPFLHLTLCQPAPACTICNGTQRITATSRLCSFCFVPSQHPQVSTSSRKMASRDDTGSVQPAPSDEAEGGF